MFRLVKAFGQRQYAEDFLDGKLYMNTLGYFWDHGHEDQMDMLEGVAGSMGLCETDMFPEEFVKAQAYEYQIIPLGFKYCNVCCFSMQTLNGGSSVSVETSNKLPSFGKYVVAIDDPLFFLNSLRRIADLRGFKYLCGPVEYVVPKPARPGYKIKHTISLRSVESVDLDSFFPSGLPKEGPDAFAKGPRYGEQKEWRIALYRGTKNDSPLVMNIGSLRSAAHLVPFDDWEELDRDTTYAATTACGWMSEQLQGNVSRS